MSQAVQVQELGNEGLTRKLKVVISKDSVAEKENATLVAYSHKMNFKGFRPGKAPLSVVRQNYGAQARGETIEKLISETISSTLAERKLRPAVDPKIENVSANDDQDVSFNLTVEVMPEIPAVDHSSIKVERLEVDVPEDEIRRVITAAVKQTREPEPAAADYAATADDFLIIDFTGLIKGEADPIAQSEEYFFRFNDGRMPQEVSDVLVGAKAGEARKVSVKFAADYPVAKVAGKTVDYSITVREIRRQKDIDLDEALAIELGFESLEACREQFGQTMATYYQGVARNIIKRQILDHLADAYSFDVPQSILGQEFAKLWQQVSTFKAKGQLPAEDAKKSEAELREEYHKLAARRVRLGLVLLDISERKKIDVSNDEIRNAVIAKARRYPQSEKEIYNHYFQNIEALKAIRLEVLEEKVVDHLIANAKVEARKVTLDELKETAKKVLDEE